MFAPPRLFPSPANHLAEYLSHYAVLDKCEKLVEAGLVESVKNDRNRVFQITEKGLGFFQEFKRFQSLVESMNLRY